MAISQFRKESIQSQSRVNRIRQVIDDSRGRFFTVKFHKADGSKRVMNCRIGVKKFLKGGKLSYKPEDKPNLRVVFETRKGYRTINLDTVYYIKSGGERDLWMTEGLFKDVIRGK